MTYAAHGQAELFLAMGADVTVVTPARSGSKGHVHENSDFGYAVRTFEVAGSGLPWSRLRGDFEGMVKFTAIERPDIVISQGWYTYSTAILPALQPHTRHLVLASHGAAEKAIESLAPAQIIRSITYRYFEKYKIGEILDCLSAVVVLSSFKDLNRFSDLEQYELRGIPAFICPNYSIYRSEKTGRSLQHKKILLQVGEMSENKNQILALEILKTLPSDYFLEFAFPASNAYLDQVKDRSRALGLDDRIVYTKGLNRNELEANFKRASLLLILSRTEAQPIVAIDAICLGLPFVSTPVGCMPELRGGFIARPETMRDAVLAAHASVEVYEQLSAAASACYAQSYNPNVSSQALRKMLTLLAS